MALSTDFSKFNYNSLQAASIFLHGHEGKHESTKETLFYSTALEFEKKPELEKQNLRTRVQERNIKEVVAAIDNFLKSHQVGEAVFSHINCFGSGIFQVNLKNGKKAIQIKPEEVKEYLVKGNTLVHIDLRHYRGRYWDQLCALRKIGKRN